MEAQRKKNKRNAIIFFVLAGLFILFGLWQTADQLVIGFDIPEAALPEQGWPDMKWTDDLTQRNVRVYLYESEDGRAAATAFASGLFGRYKEIARVEPDAESREMMVSGTEEQFLITVAPGQKLAISGGIQQQSWFGMIVIDVVLCAVAISSGRKQLKAPVKAGVQTEGEETGKEAEREDAPGE